MSNFNPMQMMQQMQRGNVNAQGMPIFQQPTRQQFQTYPRFNQEQFKSYIPKLQENDLRQLVYQARMQGISDSDIEAGLNIMKNMR